MKPSLRLWTLVLFACTACQSPAPSNRYEGPPAADYHLRDGETLNLDGDRQALDELRKDVPEEKRKENDDLAFLLELFARDDQDPAKIREKFDSTLRRRREVFDREMKKERETFSRAEKDRRDQFLAAQSAERETFKSRKTSSEVSRKFFKELDLKRTDFFQAEREKRNDFESDVRDRRKRFEDFVREKQTWFSQEHRAYKKKYDEKK